MILPNWSVRVAIVLIAVGGVVASMVATTNGVGATPDSVTYVGAGRNLAAGLGFTSAYGADPVGQPITWYPPLYSSFLAAGAAGGLDAQAWARWVQAFLFGLSIAALGMWTARAYESWIAATVALLMLVSVALLPIYVIAWSEALFIVLAFGGFGFLAAYSAKGQGVGLYLAGVLLGLAWLTRYSGVAYIATGVLGTMLLLDAPRSRRFRDAVILGLISTAPLAAWILRNRLVGDTTTGREVAYHPIGRSQVWQVIDTAASWLTVPSGVPGPIKLLAAACIALVMLLAAWFLWTGRQGASATTEDSAQSPGAGVTLAPEVRDFLWLQLLSVVVYGTLLLFSLSFVDANTPLDARILAPVYVTILIAASFVLYNVWYAPRGRTVFRAIAIGVVIMVTALNAMNAWRIVHTAYTQGIGWSSVRWNESELMEQVRALPQDIVIYSNAPDGVYWQTQKPVMALPRQIGDAYKGGADAYRVELDRIADTLRDGNGAIVQVAGLTVRASSTAAEDVRNLLPMHLLVDTADGQIYVVAK